MSTKTEKKGFATNKDSILWGLSILIILAALVADTCCKNLMLSLRVFSWFVVLAIVGGLLWNTKQGATFWQFLKETRNELYKVVWPTKDETTRVTVMVAGLVILVSFIIWIVDSIFLGLIKLITG